MKRQKRLPAEEIEKLLASRADEVKKIFDSSPTSLPIEQQEKALANITPELDGDVMDAAMDALSRKRESFGAGWKKEHWFFFAVALTYTYDTGKDRKIWESDTGISEFVGYYQAMHHKIKPGHPPLSVSSLKRYYKDLWNV